MWRCSTRPLAEFVARSGLEGTLGRRLRPLPGGRPKKKEKNDRKPGDCPLVLPKCYNRQTRWNYGYERLIGVNMDKYEYKRDKGLEQEITNVLCSVHDLSELLDKSTIVLEEGNGNEAHPNPMVAVYEYENEVCISISAKIKTSSINWENILSVINNCFKILYEGHFFTKSLLGEIKNVMIIPIVKTNRKDLGGAARLVQVYFKKTSSDWPINKLPLTKEDLINSDGDISAGWHWQPDEVDKIISEAQNPD